MLEEYDLRVSSTFAVLTRDIVDSKHIQAIVRLKDKKLLFAGHIFNTLPTPFRLHTGTRRDNRIIEKAKELE